MRFYTNVHQRFNEILVRGYENGKHFTLREEFNPTFYVPSKKESKYKTLENKSVEPVKPGNIAECKEFIEKYSGVEGFDIYGNDRYICQYISEKYPEDEIKFDITKIKLVTIDIEVAAESGFPNVFECAEELLAITLQDYTTKQIICFASRPFNNTRKDVKYVQCRDEYNLIERFLEYWQVETPEVVTGWNCELYDIPYIVGRIERLLGMKVVRKLSPWGYVRKKDLFVQGRKQISCEMAGIAVIDYLDLYRKFTYKAQESYRLDHIANVELGKKKLDHSEFDTFKDFYTGNWQKFIEYNIIDVELVDQLEDKMKLIELCLTMAYDAKVNYTDVFFQVRTWDSIIYNYLKRKDIVIPPKVKTDKDTQYAGAYVKEPIPGKYDWVVSFDLNSLYPHLIMQYNISPETLRETRHPSSSVERILNEEITDFNPEYATCANGAQYRKDVRGFLPELMEKMYDERVIFKKRMIQAKKDYEKTPDKSLEKEIARCNNIQMAKKISLNSAYGAIGNQYFRYFKLANAEAITLSGQVSIRWIENKMNDYLNNILKTEGEDYVIASDTDSIYLNLGPLVDKFFSNRSSDKAAIVSILDKICQEKLEPYIDTCYQELATYVSAYDQKMVMKRENIADKGIWTAKKRYILNVWDSEGVKYEEAKLKMMGIEAIKSSTPAPCRKMIKDALNIIMTQENEDLIKFIDDFRTEFYSMPPEDIAFPRSVNGLTKWSDPVTLYKKSCPIHVRGALLYNHQLKSNRLKHKYPIIQEGEKIKYVYLKEPNVLGQNVMSFIQEFPREIPKVSDQIDYKTQFEKSFITPLKNILDVIGWKTKQESNLEFLFV